MISTSAAKNPANNAPIQKARLLVVEDDVHLLAGIRDILELEHYAVRTAQNGRQALEVLKSGVDEPPDLIVSDIMMPYMDGFQLLEEVRKEIRWVNVPFIFLTAKGEKTDINKGKLLGVDDYLTKPFDADDLLVAVASRLGRKIDIDKKVETDISSVKRSILTVLNHEFRTPLTLVVAYAEMLKVDLQTMSEEELVSFLKGVNSGADRLRRLVENFILLAELENGDVIKNYSWRKRKIEDLTPILSNAHAQIFTAENAKHHCDFEVEGTLAPFVADGELLTMAVRELMDNAIKFSKDRTSDAVVSIKVGARSDDQWLYIWVEDHGRGIPHWEFDNIWKPFYQINREETEDQGAGSGLAIVKGVVDIHFGKTDVVSKVSQGSRFTIAIPLTQPDANSPEYLAADDSIAPGIISHNRVEVHLNAAQKAELQNYYRSASSREQQERVQCILLSNQGLQPDALSDVLLYPINTLNEWMARYNEGGLAKLLM